MGVLLKYDKNPEKFQKTNIIYPYMLKTSVDKHNFDLINC